MRITIMIWEDINYLPCLKPTLEDCSMVTVKGADLQEFLGKIGHRLCSSLDYNSEQKWLSSNPISFCSEHEMKNAVYE